MDVDLSDDLHQFVSEQVRGGGYADESEVVRDSLRQMRARAEHRAGLIAALEQGRADVDAGRVKPLTGELLQDIGERARKRVATRGGAR